MADLIAKLTAWALSLRLVRVWLHYAERRGPMLILAALLLTVIVGWIILSSTILPAR